MARIPAKVPRSKNPKAIADRLKRQKQEAEDSKAAEAAAIADGEEVTEDAPVKTEIVDRSGDLASTVPPKRNPFTTPTPTAEARPSAATRVDGGVKVSAKMFLITPNSTFNSHIGTQKYSFQKGVEVKVPENVRNVLSDAGKVAKERL